MNMTNQKISAISAKGVPVTPYDIHEDIEHFVAVLEDDRIVHLVECLRVRVGAAGTGEGSQAGYNWAWEEEKQGPKGLYQLLKTLPATIRGVLNEKKESGKPYKRWLEVANFLGTQLLDEVAEGDTELFDEIIEEGPAEWLRNARY